MLAMPFCTISAFLQLCRLFFPTVIRPESHLSSAFLQVIRKGRPEGPDFFLVRENYFPSQEKSFFQSESKNPRFRH